MTPTQARAELARRELARRQKTSAPKDNLLQKFIRYGVKDPAIGILNMGREFANLPHKISGGYIPELSPSEFNFEEALGIEHPEAADKLLQFVGQYGPSLAIPGIGLGKAGQALDKIPKAGEYLTKAVSEAIPQALYSAVQAPQDSLKAATETGAVVAPFSVLSELIKSPSKKIRTAAKVGAGGLAALLGREGAKTVGFGETGADLAAVLSGALASRGLTSPKERMEKLTEGVDPFIANQRLKAAKKLGLSYLTPAEAGVSPWAAKRQGALGRTEEGSRMLYEKGRQRQQTEKDAIQVVLNQIYSPSKMDSKVKEAYQALNEVNLPTEFPLQFKNNEIINEAKHIVEKTPAYKESLKELMPKNVKLEPGQNDPQATSLVYWDHVKRALDDMISKAERSGNNNEARIMSEVRTNMRNQMDEAFPEYKEARSLYERKIVRKGLEKVFDQKEINGTNFYRALASQKKFDELMGHLKNAPEAQENLKAMRLLFKDLMGPPTIKTAKGTEERGMNQSRSSGAFLENLLEHAFTGGKHDVEAIKFITSKNWLKQMESLSKISNKQLKLASIAMVLSRGIGQGAGQQQKKPLNIEITGGNH
jgi:hypothetical protein